MATLAISAVGAGIGFMVGGPMGAEIGWMAGSLAGSLLFPQKVQGPQLADKEVHLTSYGHAIPLVYGVMREPADYIYSSELQEHSHTQSAKGGPQVTSYTYTVDCAVRICAGPMAGIVRIWMNKRLVYDASASSGAVTIDPVIAGMRIYLGTETQTADPLLVAATGNHPAYRGICYVVFEALDVSTHFGNRPPMIEAEVAGAGTSAVPPPQILLDVSATYGGAFLTQPLRDFSTGYVWTAVREGSGPYSYWMYAYNEASGNLIRIPFPVVPSGAPEGICLVESTHEIWVVWQTYPYGGVPFIAVFSADAFAATGTITIPGGVSGWTGNICFDADNNKVLVGMNNLGDTVYVFEPLTHIYDGAVSCGSIPFTMIPMPGTGLVACWWSSTTTVTFIRYTGIGASGYSYAGSVALPHYLGGFAYDSLRHRLAYFPNPSWGTDPIRVIDGVTLAYTDYTNPGPGVGAGQGLVIYHVQNDCYYAVGDPVNNTLWGVDAGSFTANFSASYGSASGDLGYLLECPGIKTYLFDQGGYFTSQYRRLFLAAVVNGNGVPLSSVVADLCVRSGMLTGDINVTALTDTVNGYSVRQVMPGRSAIEPLMQAYFFDAVESDDVLKFVKRGGAVAVTIPEDDLAAHDHQAAMPDQLALTRGQELDLPAEIVVQYVDATFDFQVNAQYSRRLATVAKGKVTVALAINLSATAARRTADVLLYEGWMGRTAGALQLGNKYAYLEPTDVIEVIHGGNGYRLRLIDKHEAAGIYTFNAALDDASIYNLDPSGYSTPGAAATPPVDAVVLYGPSALQLLDIPLLRDQDDGIGYYAAAAGYLAGWPGMQLYKSTDGGSSWLAFDNPFLAASVIGTTTAALGDFHSGTLFDETSTLTVTLINAAMTLASVNELAVLNGQNAALVGNELIQFKTATLTAPGKYVLSGLLRGRKGTEWAMSGHIAGERFVFLNATALHLEAAASSEWTLPRLYKPVTLGATLAATGNLPFTDTAVAQKCYAPVLLGGGRDASGNLTLNWTRRTRAYGAWNDLTDVPLGEASENYVINIYSSSAYTTLKRTLTATTPTVAYSAANQTTDFGSPQATIYWTVAQVSATTGNGYSAKGAT